VSIIGPATVLSQKPHRIEIWNPDGTPVPDGDGEYDQAYAYAAYVYGLIEAATTRRLERFTRSGTVASATHVITCPYTFGVTTKTRLFYDARPATFGNAFGNAFNRGRAARRFDVLGYRNINELSVELELAVQELVQ
jgi:hypothetical protein